MITGSMVIHWMTVVIFIALCIFLILGIVASALLVQWICYTTWRSPSTTMREKIGSGVQGIFSLIFEAGLIYVCLTGIHADGSPALLPQSDYTYWAIFFVAFGCSTLALLYLERWLDVNTVKGLFAEALAQRSDRRAKARQRKAMTWRP